MKQLIKSLGCVVLICAATLAAQEFSAGDFIIEGKQVLGKGYAAFDKVTLLKARGLFERAVNMEPENQWAQYHLLLTDYRLIIYFSQPKDEEHLDQYLDTAVEEGLQLIQEHPENAEAKALMCSVYGMKISVKWLLAPVLGPKSQKFIAEALEIAPENPRVLLQAGISKYNTPAFFGGDKEEAVSLFQRAIEQFGNEPGDHGIQPDWGYPDACAWLGMAYTNDGKYAEAIDIFERALETHPNFGWIKYNLLPDAKSKIASAEEGL